MAVEIKMPQLSDTMNAGKILSWNKKEGDPVKRGDILAEVETEKANLEIESFHQGVLLQIRTVAGSSAKVGEVIAVIGAPGEMVAGTSPVAASTPAPVTSATPSAPTGPVASAPVIAAPSHQAPSERQKVSPLARRLAEEHQINLATITGSGPGGRIVSRDLPVTGGATVVSIPAATTPAHKVAGQSISGTNPTTTQVPVSLVTPPAAAPSQPAEAPTAAGSIEGTLTPLSKMRDIIARRMQESVTQSPHFYTMAAITMDDAVALRELLKSRPEFKGVSINHLVIKAAAYALAQEPRVNAAIKNGMLFQPNNVNVGIITAVDDGLLIPVMHNADKMSLKDLVFEAKAAVERARAGRPSSSDLSGGTFSISNMGMYDIENFTAIINPGQGAVLAVSSIKDEPIVINGAVVVAKRMRVTLSVDHRIIDGVMSGNWLKHFKEALEKPALLLL